MRDGQYKILHQNSKAVFGWFFIIIWLLTLFLFSGIVIKGRGNEFNSFALVILMIWIPTVPVFIWLIQKPVIYLYISTKTSHVLVVEKYLFKKNKHMLSSTKIGTLNITEGEDNEGNPYFSYLLFVERGSKTWPLKLVEGHSRELVQATFNKIQKQLN